ncbi:MAG: glycerophosphodiester phosphodiesterase [Spirochaetales bacterium]|nr:glycerophosphodiester phosphodiesterase [Spirochaetales bacterium]
MRRKDRNIKPFDFAEYPLLFGHRGCSKAAPENTLASFKKILDNNIPGVELDVQICKSGEIVVLHDQNLVRTTGFNALVSETNLEDIKKLDTGSWFNESYAGEKIPTLDEVFELLGKNVYYDIEIKQRDRKHGEFEKKLVEKIAKWNIGERVIISSFNPISIIGIRAANPLLNTAIIYCSKETIPWWLRNGAGKYLCQPNILKPCKQKVSPFTMFINNKIQKYMIVSWTIDDPLIVQKYLNHGVDGIVTNAPEDMLDIFRERWDS